MNKQDCAVCSNPVEYIASMVLYLQAAVNLCGPMNRLFAAFHLRIFFLFPLVLLHIPEPATDRAFISRKEETTFSLEKIELTAAAAGRTGGGVASSPVQASVQAAVSPAQSSFRIFSSSSQRLYRSAISCCTISSSSQHSASLAGSAAVSGVCISVSSSS